VGEGPNWTGLTPGGRERGGGGRDGGRPFVAMVGWFSYTSSSSSRSGGAPFTKKLSGLCKPLWVKRFPFEPKSSTVGDVVKALVREGGSENSRSLASKWFAGEEEPGSLLLASLPVAQGHPPSAAECCFSSG